MPKIKKEKQGSVIAAFLKEKQPITKDEAKNNFKISFQYLDTSQKYGSSFKDWQKCGLLSRMLEIFHGYSKKPLLAQIDGGKFAAYEGYPPESKTKFVCPGFVPDDAQWARIHITGQAIVVGHIVDNTFYVVFLDKTHKFWMTSRITDN